MSAAFARTPPPPYYAVVFASQRTAGEAGYGATAERMVELAATQPGFLGIESARGDDGFGITVSYWRSEADIQAWRRHAEHTLARERGRRAWYEHYELRVARVERAYGGPPAGEAGAGADADADAGAGAGAGADVIETPDLRDLP